MTTETLNHSDVQMTTDLACAYLARGNVSVGEIPVLLRTIYDGVVKLGAGSAEKQADAMHAVATAVQIRKSITPDALISFIDGRPYKTLKLHLGKHGLDGASYRARYGLPADYPLVAANYSAQRAALAKSIGLGQPGGQARRKAA